MRWFVKIVVFPTNVMEFCGNHTKFSRNSWKLRRKKAAEASEGEESRAPVDFAGVLATMKLAQNLQLNGKARGGQAGKETIPSLRSR